MPKLLWISPFNLHDTSSGAAVQSRLMLEKLAQRGVQVKVLGSFVFDAPAGANAYFPKLADEMKDAANKQALSFEQNGVSYTYMPCANTAMSAMSHNESWKLFNRFCSTLSTYRPDVCMGYGMGCFGVAVHAECRRRGIAHAYPICNANHPYYNFFDCDLLFTDSDSNANLYAQRDRLNVATTGTFIPKEEFVALDDEKNPQFITMVNPEPRKGGGIFAKLALMAQSDPELKNEKFLCVNSRGHFSTTIASLKDKNGKGYTEEFSFCGTCEVNVLFNKLKEYEDLEEQGLLLRLPCHIGDIIYEPTNRNTINEYSVTGIKEEEFALWIEWKLEKGFVYQSIYGVEVGDIGETVFLTQEEAEQKLKEMEGNHDGE